jgi:hypothetical protein
MTKSGDTYTKIITLKAQMRIWRDRYWREFAGVGRGSAQRSFQEVLVLIRILRAFFELNEAVLH